MTFQYGKWLIICFLSLGCFVVSIIAVFIQWENQIPSIHHKWVPSAEVQRADTWPPAKAQALGISS